MKTCWSLQRNVISISSPRTGNRYYLTIGNCLFPNQQMLCRILVDAAADLSTACFTVRQGTCRRVCVVHPASVVCYFATHVLEHQQVCRISPLEIIETTQKAYLLSWRIPPTLIWISYRQCREASFWPPYGHSSIQQAFSIVVEPLAW